MAKVSIAEGNRRLLVLARKLERIPRKRFNYRHWVGQDWRGKQDLSCGTSACALGWATTIRPFRKLGLRLQHNPEQAEGGGYVKLLGSRDNGSGHSMTAATRFFALDLYEAMFLFMPNKVYRGYFGPGPSATAKRVAAHIRKFVKGRAK